MIIIFTYSALKILAIATAITVFFALSKSKITDQSNTTL